MKDLIKALQILLKYGNPDYPTHCEHDVLFICNIDPLSISVEDIKYLKKPNKQPISKKSESKDKNIKEKV